MTATKAEIKREGESGHASTHDTRTLADLAACGFAETLRALREDRRWTVTTLAAEMNYSRPYVSKIESGTDPVPRSPMFARRADEALRARGRLVAAWERHWRNEGERPTQPPRPAIELVDSYDDVQAELWSIVDEASRFLVCAGSRSRDEAYLRLIEDRLRAEPGLSYHRILFGPPKHAVLRDHLLRVLEIRDPGTRHCGAGKSLFMAMFDDDETEPERFVCANEHRAVTIQLSLHGLGRYDTAFVVNDPMRAEQWKASLQEAYRAAEGAGHLVETESAIRALPVLAEVQP
jgi:transcriptional regulator with XRE-family HTH domain